jgi:hypothetical protein
MELPLKIDLSNLSGTAYAEVLFPLLPGGVLTLGFAITHPDALRAWFAPPYIGYYTKMVGLYVTAYVAGLLLALLLIGVVDGLAAALSNYLRGKWNIEPWRDPIWRQIARRFVEEILRLDAPPDHVPLTREQFDQKLQAARALIDDAESRRTELETCNEVVAKKGADMEWHRLYWYLDQLFPQSFPAPEIGTYLSQAAYCSAAALLVVLSWTSSPQPLLKIICWVSIAVLFVVRLGIAMAPPFSQVRQTAAMMQQLMNREREGVNGS